MSKPARSGAPLGVEVYGEQELLAHIEEGGGTFSHLVSIGDPKSAMPTLLHSHFRAHLRLAFHDVEDRRLLGPMHSRRFPRRSDVRRIVRFYRRTSSEATGYTIHCRQGISLSTAVALGILYLISGSEEAAAAELLRTKPQAAPHRRIVRYFDELLGSNLQAALAPILEAHYDKMRQELEPLEDEIHAGLATGPFSSHKRGMRILFAADLHGRKEAFERFERLLGDGTYDLGVLAGDLQDDFLPKEEIQRLLGLGEDELLDELPSPEDDPVEQFNRSAPAQHLKDALVLKVRELEGILRRAGKPVFLVEGNHDTAQWPSGEGIENIHLRRVEHGGQGFAGYRFTDLDRSREQQESDMLALARLVDASTILVTHSPARGVLDHAACCYDPAMEERPFIGSRPLRGLVDQVRPRLHLFGHVHERFGVEGSSINGSYPASRKYVSIDLGSGEIAFVE